MQPVNDEKLILLFYGELSDAEARSLRERLAADAALAARFENLAADLAALPDLPVPERDERYGRRVWARVDPALGSARVKRFAWWPMALRASGGLLVLTLVAVISFELGRVAPPPQAPESITADTNAQSARLLQASLANHLSGADRLLTEITNRDLPVADLEAEKDWAKVLLVANRLYRFAAEQAGQHRIAQLLADMEPVLIELANGAGQLTPEEYRVLRQSIAERDLVFKVRSANLALQPETVSL